MKLSVTLLISIVFFSLDPSYCVPDFLYGSNKKHAENGWKGICATGKSQSPVDIDRSLISAKRDKNEVYFKNYDKQIMGKVLDDGHTVKILFNETDKVIFVSDNKVEYHLQNMHFHWDCSEHTINNKSYNFELHLVHYNSRIGKFEKVIQQPGHSVVVVSALFEESDSDNESLDAILDIIANDGGTRRKVSFLDLLPKKLNYVYQYSGSLTTPPCYETVLWHVLEGISYISRRQIKQFQSLGHHPLESNCRNANPLNERKINILKIDDSVNDIISDNSALRADDSLHRSSTGKLQPKPEIFVYFIFAFLKQYLSV